VNKASFGIGAVMLAAAAVFIYFDEPMYVRIIAGAIFIVGAVLFYQTLAGSLGARGEETRNGEDEFSSPPPTHGTNPERNAPEPRYSDLPATGEVEQPGDIPSELYRFDSEELPQNDPRAEFDYLTNKLLQAVKEHLLAHTVGLFWINMDREQIIIGEFVTDSRNFTTARRLALGADMISRIAVQGKPEIVSDVAASSESDLAIYYDAPEGIKSLIGVPMFFQGDVIAVLVADSRVADAFGLETVASMGRFTSLINLLLGSYNQKFDLAADSRMLGVLDNMQKGFEATVDTYGIAGVAATAITEILDWDYIAVILRHPERSSWIIARSMSKAANLPYINEGSTVNLEQSVLRPALDNADGVIIDAPSQPDFRFHEKESINSFGQLCVVPLVSATMWYGLLVLEYRENHQYASQDLAVLRRIALAATSAFERAQLRESVRKHLLIDEGTRVSSRTLLLQRLAEEQERINVIGGSAVYFLIAVDNSDEMAQKYGQREIDNVLLRIGETLRAYIKVYDVLGRFDATSFGLLLLNSTAEDAFLRGEKIRKHVAGSVQVHGGMTFSVSVSIAGCTMSQDTDVDHILRLARQALDRAVSDGGNTVKVV